MARRQRDAEELVRAFSNYDTHVEIVCCWHSWYDSKVPDCCFDRFPSRPGGEGSELTPDFVVDFDNGYVLVGEVCRLPMQEDGFKKSVAQAASYVGIAEKADVAMLVPVDIAPESELRIHDGQLLADDEPVVLVAYARNTNVVRERWEFLRAAGIRSARFRDDFLEQDLSLGIHLCDKLRPLRVGIEYCIEKKRRFPFINDDPPAIYSAAYVWMYVAPLELSKEDFINRRLDDEDLVVITTPQRLQNLCESELGVTMHSDWIRSALELFVDAGLSKKQGSDFAIHLGKLRVSKSGSREVVRQIAELVGSVPAEGDATIGQTTLPLN